MPKDETVDEMIGSASRRNELLDLSQNSEDIIKEKSHEDKES